MNKVDTTSILQKSTKNIAWNIPMFFFNWVWDSSIFKKIILPILELFCIPYDKTNTIMHEMFVIEFPTNAISVNHEDLNNKKAN